MLGLLRLIKNNLATVKHDLRYKSTKKFGTYRPLRQDSSAKKAAQDSLQRMHWEQLERMKFRNRSAAYYSGSVIMLFAGLSCVAVPFYRYLCKRTGWGGNPITDTRLFTPDKVIPVETNKRIRVSFTCQASGILPWKFTPLQKEVYIVPGETALVFYRAKNLSKEDIVGMATYSVSPDHVAPYFNKIQCFCFEEQRLAAGEEVDMPVFFFIDPDFAKDSAMRNIDDVVLNYSFFKASHQDGSLSPVPAGYMELKAVEA
ncbi:hypothetical protein METBIDRAFT_47846 [Metschnikowia bicuspidata var. bicuspidata NRRL YB-4993]|uniref:Uncharacterized protein n=1 Tax=Metschnikowia bicuspidata var. bicuspidata NRRL YB-4993 TaxID=869754 RepID=A0A1A0H227_9ASCO|nr:hypothetical protein METBIDRAFT_47846 [Metschnikowia bicuspidata var. bicuspidata NRRL YB-4993]OBA17977.1 hypothetical protein METBIDRAFT_47846 [Metschnikowia bicuspidata var. bicuspidata NRRL YB-4993]